MLLVIRWILFALALLFIAWIIPGINIEGFRAALLSAFVIGLVNVFIRPLFVIITIPITILTLGLFIFIINALLFLLVAKVVPGFEVDGFFSALLGSILLSIISLFINSVAEE